MGILEIVLFGVGDGDVREIFTVSEFDKNSPNHHQNIAVPTIRIKSNELTFDEKCLFMFSVEV